MSPSRDPSIHDVPGSPRPEEDTPVRPSTLTFDPFADHASRHRETEQPTLTHRAKGVGRKLLGLPPQQDPFPDRVTRGESIANSFSGTQPYVEEDPTVRGWIKEHVPTKGDAWDFTKSLFPFTSWLPRYNTTWLYGDLVAGITVGAVVVPQGMAYAVLAKLPVEYGLYSSFMGVMIYWLFATSRDITIGPVAVMSQLTGNIIIKAQAKGETAPPAVIASCLALICGCFIFVLGFLRLGFIVDFIPLPAIAAFMTGSAVNIIAGQVPTMFGIQKLLNTRAPTYWVIINTLKNLHSAKLDAAMGLTALLLLYLIRGTFVYLGKRDTKRARLWFFLSTLRTAFVILLYTMISWLVNRHRRTKPAFSILGTVPRGFKHAGAPVVNIGLIKSFADEIPSSIIVLLIEHIAISKSFGRINGYTINPSQELIAIGITNIFGPFLGAYPATGSFSRTAIKSKAGVKTPFAGLITGIVVVLALYALPAVFFYIPSASLSAVIIHAVGDLIVAPKVLVGFWRVSPLEVVIFFAGVLVTVFSSIENGIYVTVASSGGLLLYRIAKANGQFLGRVKVRGVHGGESRYAYLPLDRSDNHNPNLALESPHPGVFVYRFTDSLLYPNANHYTDEVVNYILARVKRHPDAKILANKDRAWNDPAPKNFDPAAAAANDPRPTLKAVICDFAGVQHIDTTSTQILVDVRNQLDRFAAPEEVAWHFSSIRSPWVKKALASVGFGLAHADAKPLFVVSDVAAEQPSGLAGDESQWHRENKFHGSIPVSSVDRPWFHVDIESALASALANIGTDYSGTGGWSKTASPRRPSYDGSSDRKSETGPN